jgi:ABC transporter substrate binding protein
MQFDQLRRRKFIRLLGGAAAWPLAARAQQAGKLPTMGIIGSGTPATQSHWYAAFVQRLRELGWIDGRTVAVEYRWAEGRDERFTEIAAEFVQRKVDVIVTSSTVGVVAAKQATLVIPIVFVAGDPVGTGLAAHLAELGQERDQRASQHGAYPRHGSEQPETMGESRIGCNDLDQALVEQVDVGGKPSDAAPGGGPDQIRWPVRQIAHRRGSRAI